MNSINKNVVLKISEVLKALIMVNVSLLIMARKETKFGKLQIQALSMVLARIKHHLLYYTLVHGNKAKLKYPIVALLWCKSTFEIFELGLIAVQNDFFNFRAWPYYFAN